MDNSTLNKQRCPSCTKTKMVSDENTGELFCSFCGYVITDKITEGGPEWRSFANEGTDRSRVGSATSITMHDMGLSTVISATNKDATGKPIGTSMKKSIDRLRTWDNRSQAHTSAERNLRQALSEMDKLKDKLSLSDTVIEKAAYIYRKAIEKSLVKGRSIQGPSSCMYLCCL